MTKIGVTLPQLGPIVDAELLREFTIDAHNMGFDSLWVQEHFLYSLGADSDFPAQSGGVVHKDYCSVFSPVELLAAATGWAPGISVGTSMLVGGYHWPAPLAARLATLDHLSGGRLTVGLGIGWSKEEHLAAGTDFSRRGRRMNDFVAALKACWGADPVEYHSEFFDIARSLMQPKPVQAGGPLLMSGMSSEAGLRRTAELFDLWNPSGPSRTVEQAFATLDRMNAWRASDKAPLKLVYKITLETLAGTIVGVDAAREMAVAAAERGAHEVIIETNYISAVTSKQEWLAQLHDCASIVAEVKSS